MPAGDGRRPGIRGRFGRNDLLFLVLVAAVLAVVIVLSGPETTKRIPRDGNHRGLYDSLARTGSKRQAEATCYDCHGPTGFPLPAQHPEGNRCLMCHRLERTAP